MLITYLCVQYTISYYGAKEKLEVEDAINLLMFNIFVDESRSFLYQTGMIKDIFGGFRPTTAGDCGHILVGNYQHFRF